MSAGKRRRSEEVPFAAKPVAGARRAGQIRTTGPAGRRRGAMLGDTRLSVSAIQTPGDWNHTPIC